MRLLFATPEMAPWVKTGGLGDVAGALPAALARTGADVRVLLPDYPAMRAAFPVRTAGRTLPSPGGALPPVALSTVRLADRLALLLLDAPAQYDRPGNPYLGPDGRDWPDNALRFGLLSRVAAQLAAGDPGTGWRPDVLHCNDWQTALAPAYLRYLHGGRGAATVVSIHNLAFQGLFEPGLLGPLGLPGHAFTFDGVEFHGRLSFLKAGLQACDRIATVSPTYAREILSPEFGYGLEGLLRHRAERLHGILNGIDTVAWDPAGDPALAAGYDVSSLERKAANKADLQRRLGLDAEPDAPLVGVVGRLTEQKGLDLLLAIGEALLDEDGAQIALLGTGEAWLQDGWRSLAARRPGRCAVVVGFDEALAHRIEAGADLFAMPSRFEPCGLNQMFSLRYGTPPVVRRTGGLADTVVDPSEATPDRAANGFVFDAPSAEALLAALRRAFSTRRDPAAWRALQRAGMTQDFGWEGAARAYRALYRTALADRRGRADA